MYMNLRVKDILREKGLTQKELAQKMGVAEISLSRSINGNPNLDTLTKIAQALNIEISELFAPTKPQIVCPHCGKVLNIKID